MKKCDRIDLDKPYKTIAADVKANPGNYVLMLPFYSMIELLDIRPPGQAPIIFRPNQNRLTIKAKLKIKKRDDWLKLSELILALIYFGCMCQGHAFKMILKG